MKFELNKKFIDKKIYGSWIGVAIILTIWIGFPIYEFVVERKLPNIQSQIIIAVVFLPIVMLLIKSSKKKVEYWKKYGPKICIELLEDSFLFFGPDGETKLPYSTVKDIKLDIKWHKLKAIHIETISGNSYIIEGVARLEEMVVLLRGRFPELVRK